MTDTQVITDLESALERIDPLTEDEVNRALRIISRRAWEASQEHRQVCAALGEAHAAAESAYWTALLGSQEQYPERRVGHHEAIAKHAALDLAARAKGMELMERSLRKEMEVLEKLVSALQTQAKQYREAA